MFCAFVYASGSEEEFEAGVPLLRYGEYMRSRGVENRLNIFFMKGLSRFSVTYRTRLESLGYVVSDKEAETQRIALDYPVISRMPIYYAYNYFRWLLPYKMLLSGELGLPVIVVDGDIVFTAPFGEIEDDVRGKTFILQGNPCFTSISDVAWFEAYSRELMRLEKNPDDIDEHARIIRRKQVRPDRQFCNASVYSIPIRHDQDFLQYLIGADLIPQDRTDRIFSSSLYWAQNALFPGQWFQDQLESKRTHYLEERDGECYVSNKKLAFIHFQNDFAWYAHCAYRFKKLGLDGLTPLLANEKETGRLRLPARVIGQLLKRLDYGTQSYSRSLLYSEVLNRDPLSGNMYVTDIINCCW